MFTTKPPFWTLVVEMVLSLFVVRYLMAAAGLPRHAELASPAFWIAALCFAGAFALVESLRHFLMGQLLPRLHRLNPGRTEG
jgi:hypothetical protein